MMKTSIVILTHNKLDYTMQCIESIRRYTKTDTYELIIIDNNSSDGTVEWLSNQSDLISILNDTNRGFPAGCNQGIEIATGDYILLLNNDTVVTNNWLENMLTCLNSDETIGAVGCVTNSCSYYQSIQVDYKDINDMQRFADSYNVSNPLSWEERLKLVGYCMLIKRTVIDEVGSLDERFTPGNYEDDDLSLRIRQAGYKLMLCKDTFIHHYGSVSFRENNKFGELLTINARKFEEKWGFNPNYSQHVRMEIIELMDFDLDQELNILEVGCACGGTLLKIKDKYKKSKLYGMELNRNSAKVASLIADVSAANIEKEELSYPAAFFDVIIFADVLEHLYDPWLVLENMKRYLKPDGKLLISLPNIMHKSVVTSLLQGFWTYEDAGIMDRTHLRFFTLNEINKMMLTTGYTNINIKGKTIPQQNQIEKNMLDQLSKFLPAKVMQQMNVYQYILSVNTNVRLIESLEHILSHEDEKERTVELLNNYQDYEIIHNMKSISEKNRMKLFNIIAVSHFEMGVYDRVVPFFREVLMMDEADPDALYNMAYILRFFGEYEDAILYETRLKEVNTQLYENLMTIYADSK